MKFSPKKIRWNVNILRNVQLSYNIAFLKLSKSKENIQNVLFSFYYSLSRFTTSETEIEYYINKLNINVVSRITKRLKTHDLR